MVPRPRPSRAAVHGPALRRLVPTIALLALFSIAAADPPLLKQKIEFDGKDGEEIFRLDPEGEEADLQSAGGKKTLATFAKAGSAITIELPKKDELSKVTVDDARQKYVLSDPEGKTRWSLEREPDGDWELFDGARKLVIEIKLKDYGYKLVDENDTEKGKVKKRDDKLSLRDGKDDEILRTKDTDNPLAAACFLLPGLTFPEKAAFAVSILVLPPKLTAD